MPFDGSGNFTRIHNWVDDATAKIKIRADRHDENDDDIAQGLSTCILKDGRTQITADIPWNGFKITALADPTEAQDAATKHAIDMAMVGAVVEVLVERITTGENWEPDERMLFAEVTCYGGGGAGGGHTATTTNTSIGGGGQGGAMASSILSKAEIGDDPVTITIGSGGAGVAGTTGGSGGVTSFGGLVSAAGGLGGVATATNVPGAPYRAAQRGPVPSAAGQVRGWTIKCDGGIALRDNAATAGFWSWGGDGGETIFGGGGTGFAATGGTNGGGGGGAQANTGSGGGGAACGNSNGAGRAGGAGGSGVCIIKQYLGAAAPAA